MIFVFELVSFDFFATSSRYFNFHVYIPSQARQRHPSTSSFFSASLLCFWRTRERRKCKIGWEREEGRQGSSGLRDSLPSYLTTGLGTMSSPTGSSGVHCNPFDAVVRERITVAPQVDEDSSSDCQTPAVLDALDPYINDLCFTEIPTDGMSLFGNNVNYSIFSDHEFSGTNLMYDVTEGFVLFPSLERSTMDTADSHYGASCEESQQMSDNTWFHYMCPKSTQEFEVSHCQIDSNEVDYSDPESFIKTFLDLSDESNSLPALVSKETSKKKHTLVLDLDETLIHSTWEPCYGVDFTIQFTDNDNKDQTVYVRKRPFLEVFLRRVSEIFEVIIFTASQRCYSEKLLDVLDPDRKFFSGRRYRDSCILLDEVYTKDLTVLGIDLAKVFIVDNSPQVFRLQPDNGIPIESWFDDDSDSSLMSLLPFLETLVDVDDVRPIIAQKFRAS